MILNVVFLLLLLLPRNAQAESEPIIDDLNSTTQPQEPEQKGLYTVGAAYFTSFAAYTGAAVPGSKDHSIVQHFLTQQGDIITGLTPPRVQINYIPDQPNPLYDKKILHLNNGANKPIAVPADIPNVICLLENLITTSQQSIITIPPLNDAQGNEAQAIVCLETAVTGTSDTSLHVYTIAAISPHEGFFGDDKSGFSLIKHHIIIKEELTKEKITIGRSSTKTELQLDVLDATNGIEFGNKAIPLGIHEISSALNINGGLASITPNVIDMCWHPNVERLYIALHIKTKADATNEQGARALLVARIHEDKLILDPITPDALCNGNDKIIGAVGPNQEISLHKVRPFITSTGIRYLIVLGGHGAPETTKRCLYALPLAHCGHDKSRHEVMQDHLHGTLAAKSDMPHAIYGYDKTLTARLLTTPAKTAHDLYSCYDPAIGIGNQSILPNDITDIYSSGDAVFVSVAQPGNGQQPGIFHSQAILDNEGRIAAWTCWQRFGVEVGVAKFSINPTHYTTSFLYSDLPLFVLTQWKHPLKRKKNEQIPPPDDILEGLIETIFPQEHGGLQGLVDFSCTTPGLSTQENPLSLMIAMGQKKVALIQTGGNNKNGIFTAHKNMFLNTIAHAQETINPNQPSEMPKTLIFSDDILAALGSITCAAIGTNGTQSWLFVGGARGVAVLTDAHGNGWSTEHGIAPLFETHAAAMNFKKCGNSRFIQKLICDNNNLYIITNKTVERIPLSPESLLKPELTAHTLVKSNTEIIFDGSVSGPLVLLATSNGLLHNPQGTDARYENNTLSTSRLTSVKLPCNSTCVYKLFFVTRTRHEHDFAHGAQLFASTGSLAENKTDVFRLYIDNVYEKGIKETTVQATNDHIYKDIPTPFLSFNNFRSNFVTDGSHYFSSRSRQTSEKPFLNLIPQEMIKKVFVSDHFCSQMPLQGHKANNIVKIVQNSATGNWIAAGDFGIRSNE